MSRKRMKLIALFIGVLAGAQVLFRSLVFIHCDMFRVFKWESCWTTPHPLIGEFTAALGLLAMAIYVGWFYE